MTGKDYVAQVRLSDPENKTLAEAGQTCERVPAGSLAWLADQGLIKAAPAPAKTGRRAPASGEE